MSRISRSPTRTTPPATGSLAKPKIIRSRLNSSRRSVCLVTMFSRGAMTAAVLMAAVPAGVADASAAPTEQTSAAALYERCVVVSAEWHSTPYGPRPPTKAHRLRKLAACDAFYRELAGSDPEASGRSGAPDTASPAEGDAA